MLSKTQAKYIQSLLHKKFREQYGQYIIEGTKLLSEAIHYKLTEIRRIYALPEWIEDHSFLKENKTIDIIVADEEDMKKITALATPGAVLAIMDMPARIENNIFAGITLLLDGIQDPGNLGTIIRTADWFGIRNIICGEGTADCYNSKVIQSTMGSIFRMNIIYQDLAFFLESQPNIPVLVSALDGEILEHSKREKNAFLVIGNESKGIRKEIMDRATAKLRIQGRGEVESLNAAIATGILLYWITVDQVN